MGSQTEDNKQIDLDADPDIEEYEVLLNDSPVDEIENLESDPIDLRVGILNDPFVTLAEIAEKNKKDSKRTLCALLIDETKLHQKFEKYKGKTWGYTEGIGKTPLIEPKKMATKAVVFMVISLTENWKIPIGLFFVHNPDIKYFSDTIEETLTRLDEIDIDIISITLNCVSPHLSFALAEELGAEIDYIKSMKENIKPYFPHPVHGNMVYIIYDLDIILGSLKNYWAAERTLLYKHSKIKYHLVCDIKKNDENSIQPYGMESVYDWIIIRKRISYDTEGVGKTTADAMQYLKDLGHPDFLNADATIQFIKVLDLITKLSNASGQDGLCFQHLAKANEHQWKPLIAKLLEYVKPLKTSNRETPEHLSVFRVYMMGIIVSLISFLQIYNAYVKEEDIIENLPFLLTYRLGLKNIKIGLFEDWVSGTMTALNMFKKIKTLIENIHPID